MSNNATTAPVKSVKSTKKKRAAYGFELNFPETFTMRQLRGLKSHKVKYITLYMRVKNALKDGTIVKTGLQDPKHVRKGRKEIVYSRVDAKTVSASAAAAAVTVPTEVVALSDLSS